MEIIFSTIIGLVFKLVLLLLKPFRSLHLESLIASRAIQLMLPYVRWKEFQSINADVNKLFHLEETTFQNKIWNIEKKLDNYSHVHSLMISPLILNHDFYSTQIINSAYFNTRFDESGKYYGYYSFRGRNLNKIMTKEILVQISASEAVDESLLKFKSGGANNREFPDKCIDNIELRKKIFSTQLMPPIKSSDPLIYWYSFEWPKIGNDEINSDTLNFKQYSKFPIPEIKHCLRFPYKLLKVHLIEILNGEPTLSDIEIIERNENNEFIYEYKIVNKELDGIILYWQRELSNN